MRKNIAFYQQFCIYIFVCLRMTSILLSSPRLIAHINIRHCYFDLKCLFNKYVFDLSSVLKGFKLDFDENLIKVTLDASFETFHLRLLIGSTKTQ